MLIALFEYLASQNKNSIFEFQSLADSVGHQLHAGSARIIGDYVPHCITKCRVNGNNAKVALLPIFQKSRLFKNQDFSRRRGVN